MQTKPGKSLSEWVNCMYIMFWDQVNFRTVFNLCHYQSDAYAWLSKNIGEGIVHLQKEFGINIVRTQLLFFGSEIAHLGTF
jgi:hypothetical protein